MSEHRSTLRFATVLAVALALFATGLVSGAAGDPLILGSLSNHSGASGTRVSTSVNGNAFAVAQTGSGNAANGLRGDASDGTGGVFTSTNNNALFATVANGNRFAMVAVNGGGAGTGGGLFANGNANPAIVAEVDSNAVDPIEVNSTALVDNLNADRLDGRHAIEFHEYGATVPFLRELTGLWVVSIEAVAGGDQARGGISYPVPTFSALTPHVIDLGAPVPAECSGSADAPGADPGHLCIFVGNEVNVASYAVFDHDGFLGSSTRGAYVRITSAAASLSLASGTWAATAPGFILPLSEPEGPRDGEESAE